MSPGIRRLVLAALTAVACAWPCLPVPWHLDGSASALAVAPASVPPGVAGGRLLVEPQDAERPLIRAIDHAQSTVFVETYILSDRDLVHALERAAAQDVGVYVLLEPHPLGLGTQPQHIADDLRAAGVHVRWTAPAFALTHAKLLLLDDRLAIISTANFSRSAFHSNRELIVFESERSVVHDVSALFRADWDQLPTSPHDPELVVSPSDARVKLTALLLSARNSVRIYAEELLDAGTERVLAGLQRRGVRVRIILPRAASDIVAAWAARSRIQVRAMDSPYAHAKMIMIDEREAFVGSENLSAQSLDRNREVGLFLRGAMLRRIASTFEADWRRIARARA